MKPGLLKKRLAGVFVIAVGSALLGTASTAGPLVLDWRVIGTGTVIGSCQGVFTSGCTSLSSGVVLGTHLGSGSYALSLTAGSDSQLPGQSNATNSSNGKCLPANGVNGITTPNAVSAANGDLINFNTVGWICEEGGPGSSYHYNGTYRITSGTGRFSNVVGGGNLAATFEKGAVTDNTYIKIDGTINF